ncbi:MAG: hypothetical protein IKQ94_11635 [Bacteroidales bacterium]|nr:hypothetical protein [Bacteroidales bacterium]
MTWLWVIIAVGIIGAIIGFLSDGKEGAVEGGLGAAFGCGAIIFRIFITVLSIVVIIALFGWLFKGC